MKLEPQNDYVIVEKLSEDTTTSSGIILTTTQGADKCKVLAISESVKGIEAGDVLMIRWSNALKIFGNVYAVDKKEIVTKYLD